MTITSSLNAGVMGLNVNATRLAAISDNIANSATDGYKRAEVDFSSLVVNQRPSIYSAGGVRSTAYRAVSDVGTLTTTGRSTDIAINGNGMIPVTNITGVNAPATERDFMMVSTGGFSPDENGRLVTSSGLYLLGWEVDASGQALTSGRSSQTGLVPVSVGNGSFAAEATQNINLGLNLPADATQVPVGESISLPVEYFDQLGLAQNLNMAFTRTGSGTWDATVTDDATGAVAGTFSVTFGANGLIDSITAAGGAAYDAATGDLTFNSSAGPIETFLGRAGENEGLTQLGSTFTPYNVQTDGSPVGQLQSVEINSEGFVEAIYNTGVRRTIFQIPVAAVTNPDGMTAQGNQAFSVSTTSGDFYLWDAGDGPTGDIASYALMQSNTNIASELTSLIETQRAYSSNAKIIQTVDEMLQETTNLKR